MSAGRNTSGRQAVVYLKRAALERFCHAARAMVTMETETARNSHAVPGRARRFRADWQEADPEHFAAVEDLRQACNAAARRLYRRV